MEIADGCSLELPVDVPAVCRDQKRCMRVAVCTGLPGTWSPGVHANCIHNEIAALLKRSLCPLPRPANSAVGSDFDGVRKRLCRIARAYGGYKWTHLETAHSYTGAMRRKYVEAEESLRVIPIGSRDAEIKAFLKAEKCGAGKDAKPRMIFPRSPRFNLAIASWLKPFEHWIWGYLTARRLFNGSNTRVVAKGLNPCQRANLIKRKFDGFRHPVCFEVDGKAFEAHVTSGQVDAERSVYLHAYGGDSRLARLLSMQAFAGKTASGVKFSRPGGRASGDFNTGMGNSLLMLCSVVGVMLTRRVKFDILVDGDNALLFCEQSDLGVVLENFASDVLADSGHELTLEEPVTVLERIRFGRSAPVFLGSMGYTMVREPWNVLSGACASHRWLSEPAFARRWLSGVARCELSLARGVPVLQAHALKILRVYGVSGKELPQAALADYFVVGARLAGFEDVVEVSREARLSFERAFGLSPEEQVSWENQPIGVGVDFVERVWRPSSKWLEADPGFYEPWFDALN